MHVRALAGTAHLTPAFPERQCSNGDLRLGVRHRTHWSCAELKTIDHVETAMCWLALASAVCNAQHIAAHFATRARHDLLQHNQRVNTNKSSINYTNKDNNNNNIIYLLLANGRREDKDFKQ